MCRHGSLTTALDCRLRRPDCRRGRVHPSRLAPGRRGCRRDGVRHPPQHRAVSPRAKPCSRALALTQHTVAVGYADRAVRATEETQRNTEECDGTVRTAGAIRTALVRGGPSDPRTHGPTDPRFLFACRVCALVRWLSFSCSASPHNQAAPSPSGKAEVCKTSIPGSNPGGASNLRSRLSTGAGATVGKPSEGCPP